MRKDRRTTPGKPPSSGPAALFCLLPRQPLSGYRTLTASGFSLGHRCRMGALEGAAALTMIAGSRRAERPNLWPSGGALWVPAGDPAATEPPSSESNLQLPAVSLPSFKARGASAADGAHCPALAYLVQARPLYPKNSPSPLCLDAQPQSLPLQLPPSNGPPRRAGRS